VIFRAHYPPPCSWSACRRRRGRWRSLDLDQQYENL
jgi:hypothetical protein